MGLQHDSIAALSIQPNGNEVMNGRIAGAVAAGLVAAGLAIYCRPRREAPASPPVADGALSSKHAARPRLPVLARPTPSSSVESPTNGLPATNLLGRLMNGSLGTLTAEQVGPYLDQNRRSPGSLLAAFRATGDKAFLQEALEKYPTDPRVNYAAVFKSDSPDSRARRRSRIEDRGSRIEGTPSLLSMVACFFVVPQSSIHTPQS